MTEEYGVTIDPQRHLNPYYLATARGPDYLPTARGYLENGPQETQAISIEAIQVAASFDRTLLEILFLSTKYGEFFNDLVQLVRKQDFNNINQKIIELAQKHGFTAQEQGEKIVIQFGIGIPALVIDKHKGNTGDILQNSSFEAALRGSLSRWSQNILENPIVVGHVIHADNIQKALRDPDLGTAIISLTQRNMSIFEQGLATGSQGLPNHRGVGRGAPPRQQPYSPYRDTPHTPQNPYEYQFPQTQNNPGYGQLSPYDRWNEFPETANNPILMRHRLRMEQMWLDSYIDAETDRRRAGIQEDKDWRRADIQARNLILRSDLDRAEREDRHKQWMFRKMSNDVSWIHRRTYENANGFSKAYTRNVLKPKKDRVPREDHNGRTRYVWVTRNPGLKEGLEASLLDLFVKGFLGPFVAKKQADAYLRSQEKVLHMYDNKKTEFLN